MGNEKEEASPQKFGGIRVEKDGVRLGWNVLAVIATIGLGLYVSNIVTPIRTDILTLQKEVEQLIEDVSFVTSRQTEHSKNSAVIHSQLEQSVISVKEQCSQCQKQLEALMTQRGD